MRLCFVRLCFVIVSPSCMGVSTASEWALGACKCVLQQRQGISTGLASSVSACKCACARNQVAGHCVLQGKGAQPLCGYRARGRSHCVVTGQGGAVWLKVKGGTVWLQGKGALSPLCVTSKCRHCPSHNEREPLRLFCHALQVEPAPQPYTYTQRFRLLLVSGCVHVPCFRESTGLLQASHHSHTRVDRCMTMRTSLCTFCDHLCVRIRHKPLNTISLCSVRKPPDCQARHACVLFAVLSHALERTLGARRRDYEP